MTEKLLSSLQKGGGKLSGSNFNWWCRYKEQSCSKDIDNYVSGDCFEKTYTLMPSGTINKSSSTHNQEKITG